MQVHRVVGKGGSRENISRMLAERLVEMGILTFHRRASHDGLTVTYYRKADR